MDIRHRFVAEVHEAAGSYKKWLDETTEAADIKINDMPQGLPYDVDMSKYPAPNADSGATDGTQEGSTDGAEGGELPTVLLPTVPTLPLPRIRPRPMAPIPPRQCRCRRGRQRLRAACGSRLSFEKVGSSEFDTAGVLRDPAVSFLAWLRVCLFDGSPGCLPASVACGSPVPTGCFT